MKKLWIALLAFATGLNLAAADKPTIYWHLSDWPPYYFTSPEMKGKGEAGATAYKAMELLTDYQHESKLTPSKRASALMKAQPNHCRSGLFKTPEREEYMYFSKQIQYYFPYGVTIHKKSLERFQPYIGKDNYIDLDKALASGEITLAINEGQSYGKSLDALLKKYEGGKNIIKTSSGVKFRETLLKRLFSSNSYHGTLAIPEEFNYHAKQQNLDGGQLLYFPVVGTELFGSGWWGYIGCSKSDLGKEVITKVNQNIDQIRAVAVARYRDFLDENAKKIHEKAGKKVFE